jgi:hypothetical protein
MNSTFGVVLEITKDDLHRGDGFYCVASGNVKLV